MPRCPCDTETPKAMTREEAERAAQRAADFAAVVSELAEKHGLSNTEVGSAASVVCAAAAVAEGQDVDRFAGYMRRMFLFAKSKETHVPQTASPVSPLN